jgi:predicted RNase H-like HicB family nuclease
MYFKVILQEAEEGGFIVSCPALPGCHSQGDNMEEAFIKEAIVGCVQSLEEVADESRRFGIGLLK